MSPRKVHNCKIPEQQIAKPRKVKRPGWNESSFHLLTYFPQQSPSSPPKLLKIWSVPVTHLSTRATKRKIQSRSDFYPVALTQIFSIISLLLVLCSATCSDGNVRLVSFIWWTCLSWSLVWSSGDTNFSSVYKPPFSGGGGGGLTNTLKLKNYPGLFWVIVSVMELRGARQTEELSRDELMHSRCTVKRLQRAAHFTAKVRIVTPQRLKISLWFMLLFASSCGSSQQNQQMLTLDFTSQSRMLLTYASHDDHFQLILDSLI